MAINFPKYEERPMDYAQYEREYRLRTELARAQAMYDKQINNQWQVKQTPEQQQPSNKTLLLLGD